MTQDCPQPMDTNLMAPPLPLETNNRAGNLGHLAYFFFHSFFPPNKVISSTWSRLHLLTKDFWEPPLFRFHSYFFFSSLLF